MRQALFLAPFGELSDPLTLVEIARSAEAHGWDGLFLWDHMLREASPLVGDVWVSLAAVAMATERLVIGPMVTPITRRRPQKLARETVAVDRLSGGRLVVGLGLGVDSGGELTRFAEVVDPIERGERLDEGAALLLALWSGETVEFRGRHFTADGVPFLPRAVQEPHPPLWFAARGTARRPVRRAARIGDGLHAIEVDPDGLRAMIDIVVAERSTLDGFDIACNVAPGTDPSTVWSGLPVTWAMHAFPETAGLAEILPILEAGPPGPR